MARHQRVEIEGQDFVMSGYVSRHILRKRQVLEGSPAREDQIYDHKHPLIGRVNKDVSGVVVRPSAFEHQGLVTNF